MSSRNFRRVAGQSIQPLPPDDSDEDYQPLYAQRSGNSTYAGLVVSSQSESDRGSEHSEEEARKVCVMPSGNDTKKKNQKKKNKGKGRRPVDELDEIDRSVLEVNALLGAPPPAPVQENEKIPEALVLLTVDPKHLNVTNEVRKRFGPEHNEHRRRPNRVLLLRRVMVHPNRETLLYDYNNTGLSMLKYKDVKKRMYFVYTHSEAYQRMHRAFLAKYEAMSDTDILLYLDEARQNMHVEALLEISDRCFRNDETGPANEILENVVIFLQYVAHPLFILSQNNVRLEYKFMENRPFHVAMLKYIYLLSNKACHRTALEIAKMLLILDPNDPLAILMILDVLALRAREHEWLIETINYFDRQREAKLLFNIMYSNGLAHFHVALKNKLDFAEADSIIREAILAHPQVLVQILEVCNVSKPDLISHRIFKPDPKKPWSAGVNELFQVYAKMTAARWTEPAVMTWLVKSATELCADYDKDSDIRDTAKHWDINRYALFQVWPPEYVRHVSVFCSVSKLILDSPMTSFNRPTCAWDPLFDRSINRYNYSYKTAPPPNVGVSRSPVYRFFHSMIPSFYEPPVDD